ncbi:MAG: drug/metabolite transporter (DMT)-like permease [Hyphomicrobiaceae bacterium]|jgi:drug/metabolite transporter (DMT)-like permease
MTRLQANMMLLAIAAIWGLAFVYQKTAMDHIGPYTFLAMRALIAAVILTPIAYFWEQANSIGKPAPGFWMIACAGGLSFFIGGILQQIGLVTATVTNTGFLTGLYVVITPLLMWLVLARPPAAIIWVAVSLAFVGTWFLGGGTVGGFSTGDWLVVASSFFWATHMLVIEHSGRYVRPIGFTAVQFALVALISGACALAIEGPALTGLIAAAPEIAYVGVLSSALTFTMLAVAMRYTPAAEATIIVSTETVFAAIAGVILLGEQLQWIGWFGAALMFSATLIVQLGPIRRPEMI